MKFNVKKYKEFLYETGRIEQKYHVNLDVDKYEDYIQILQKKGLNSKTIAFIILDKKAEIRPIFEAFYQLEDRFRTELFNHLMRYTTSLNEEPDEDEEKCYLRHYILQHNDYDFIKKVLEESWDRVDQDIEDVMRSGLARYVDIIGLDYTAFIVSSVVKERILEIIDGLNEHYKGDSKSDI